MPIASSANVPWSPQKRDLGDEIYYDAVVHDAQLLYLLARHFPARVERARRRRRSRRMSAAVSGNRASSLSAAYTLLALDAFAKAAAGADTLGIAEIGKDGRERALDAAGRRDAEGRRSRRRRRRCSSRSAARCRRTSSSTNRASIAIRRRRRSARASRSSASSSTRRATPLTRVTVGQEFFVRLRVRATRRDREPQIAIVDLLPGGVEPVLELQPAADSSTPASIRRWRGSAGGRVAADRRAGQVRLGPEPRRRARRSPRPLRRRDEEHRRRSSIACARPTPARSRSPPAFAEGHVQPHGRRR